MAKFLLGSQANKKLRRKRTELGQVGLLSCPTSTTTIIFFLKTVNIDYNESIKVSVAFTVG